MEINKSEILKNLCYTELVYGRINKKLCTNFTRKEIENFIKKILQKTNFEYYYKKGKNYYIVNEKHNIRITINSYTYRIITVDRLNNIK